MSLIVGDHLKSYIERIERLEEDKAAVSNDIKDVYLEAKGNGFVPKVMKEVVKKRKLEKAELEEEETLLDLYKNALGML